jgi:hypothetical protein
VNDQTLEETVRDALHDAAEHANLQRSVPLADAPTRVTVAGHRTRARLLVAACIVVIGVGTAAGAVLATRDDDNVRITSPANGAREVPVADIPRLSADFEVFMDVQATDDERQGVQDLLERSPDVSRYSSLDREAQYREFAEAFSCNAALVHSIEPKDLPPSFRVIATSPEAVDGLRAALDAAPGVQATETPDSTATSDCSGTSSGGEVEQAAPVLPAPSTTPPTLPPAGDPPPDATSARDAVVAAFTQAWDGTGSIEQRRAAMQGSDQLAGALDRARQGNEATIASMRAVLGDVSFVGPDRAAVLFHLEFDGGLIEPTMLGYAVLEDGAWKVSRETVCAVLGGVGGVSCPS